MEIFVILKPDGTPFYRDDAMGILATDSEAQAIRFQHAREEEGAEYVRYTRTQPPAGASQSSTPNPVTPGLSSESAASVSERARELLAHELSRSGFIWNPAIRSDSLIDPQEAAVRAIEQALTQQRGSDLAWTRLEAWLGAFADSIPNVAYHELCAIQKLIVAAGGEVANGR